MSGHGGAAELPRRQEVQEIGPGRGEGDGQVGGPCHVSKGLAAWQRAGGKGLGGILRSKMEQQEGQGRLTRGVGLGEGLQCSREQMGARDWTVHVEFTATGHRSVGGWVPKGLGPWVCGRFPWSISLQPGGDTLDQHCP